MGAAEKHEERLPFWPAALTWAMALAYTNVSEAQMSAWRRDRRVIWRARGPNGALIALRSDLDAALADLLSLNSNEDLDFG